MNCPTCAHAMLSIGLGYFWCPIDGTLHNEGCTPEVPALVQRCRDFAATGLREVAQRDWCRLGIAEAIHLPGERGDNAR